MLSDGSLISARDDIETFLISFWTPGSEYLRAKEARKQKHSTQYLDAHRAAIKNHFLPYFEDNGVSKLNELTPANLGDWQNWAVLDHGLSARTHNRTRQAVWTALQWEVDRDLLPRHPGRKVGKLPEEKPIRQIFERAELEQLFTTEWQDFRTCAAAALAECTGMRLGEVRGLLVKNVHLKDGYVDVLTNYVEPDGLKDPKASAGNRLGIQMSPLAAAAIERVLDRHQWGAEPNDIVFFDFDRRDIPMSKVTIETALKNALIAVAPGR